MNQRKPEIRSAPVSAALAVQSLEEAVADYEQLNTQLSGKLEVRNDLIRSAADYIPLTRLGRITGLTRQQIYRIIGTPSKRSKQ